MNKLELIEVLERDYSIFNWRINGVSIWPIIRIQLHFFDAEKKERKNSTKQYLKNPIRIIRQWLSTWKLIMGRNSRNYLFLLNDYHRKTIDNVSVNGFAEKIISQNNIPKSEILGIEPDFKKTMQLPNNPSYEVYHDIYFMKYWAKKRGPKKLDIAFPLKKEVEQFVEKEMPEVLALFSNANIIRKGRSVLGYAAVYDMIIRKRGVKKLVLAPFYGDSGLGACLAAKRNSIDAIDIQHGLQAKGHLAYSNYHFMPDEGYKLLPSIFWVWTSSEKERILSQFQNTRHNSIIGGHPFFQTKSKIENVTNRKRILFTAQPLANSFPDKLVNFIRATQDSIQWKVRLHPAQWSKTEDILQLIRNNGLLDLVEFDLPTKEPLDEVLRNIDLHITLFSSCTIEAALMGIATVLLEPKAKDYFKQYISDGTAIVVDELKEDMILHKFKTSGQLKSTRENTKQLFALQ